MTFFQGVLVIEENMTPDECHIFFKCGRRAPRRGPRAARAGAVL